jgi:small-conductance mechanosensitive channel
MRPSLAGGKAALVSYGVSEKGADGRVRHYRAEAYLETGPVGQGAWMMMGVIMRAPDATFERDLPAMRSMVFSLKENAQVISQKTQQALNEQNQRFQAQQQAHRQQVEGFERQQQAHREVTRAYDRQHQDWEKNQKTTSRSHDDYDEVLRGYRTVEDTRSGVKTSVDLGNVDVIVDKLNEANPGRYRQIPLRDEMDPLPGR